MKEGSFLAQLEVQQAAVPPSWQGDASEVEEWGALAWGKMEVEKEWCRG